MAGHYEAMKLNKKEHKYTVLNEANRRGYKVLFHIIYRARLSGDDMREEIGEREGYYIRRYMPPLNTQIPDKENWRHFTINRNASTVTLDDILKGAK